MMFFKRIIMLNARISIFIAPFFFIFLFQHIFAMEGVEVAKEENYSFDRNVITKNEEITPFKIEEQNIEISQQTASFSRDEDIIEGEDYWLNEGSKVEFDPSEFEKGMLGAFEVDTFSGAAVYRYPISLPLGHLGLKPNLMLIYNSHNRNLSNICGYGWELDGLGYIERYARKGVNHIYTENTFRLNLNGEVKELVSLGGSTYGEYGARIEESFYKITFESESGNDYWVVRDKNATEYIFGGSGNTRQHDPGDPSRVYRWVLEEIRDINNNFIKFQYTKDSNQIYPVSIIYTGYDVTDGPVTINFVYSSVRPDKAVNYISGFKVQTNNRLERIEVIIDGFNSGNPVRTYELQYSGQRSLLASIVETAIDRNGQSLALPPVQFSYQEWNWNINQNADWYYPIEAYLRAGDNYCPSGTFFADLNGDALADALQSRYYRFENQRIDRAFINDGLSTWQIMNDVYNPTRNFLDVIHGSPFNYNYYPRLIFDINGDGYTDTIYAQYRALINNKGGNWELDNNWTIKKYNNDLFVSPYDRSDTRINPGYRIGDVNGDGLLDFIFTNRLEDGSEHLKVFVNRGTEWKEDTAWNRFPQPLIDMIAEYPNYYERYCGMFQIADINADGLVDFIESADRPDLNPENPEIRNVYLNNGTDGWELEPEWDFPITFLYTQEVSPETPYTKGIDFVDFNGDGLVDVSDGHTGEGFLNKGNGQWEEIADSTGHFYFFASGGDVHGPSSYGYSFIEVNGDGLIDTVWGLKTEKDESYYAEHVGEEDLDYIGTAVFTQSSLIANLLSGIIYPRGGKISISYQASPQYRDSSNQLLNPSLPLIIQTVKEVTKDDGLEDIARYSYAYKDGYYYFREIDEEYDLSWAEFAGFNLVEQIDPLGRITKTYFHQGEGSIDGFGLGEFEDDYSKKGKLYCQEIYDQNNSLFSRTIYKWDKADLANNRYFPKLAETIEFSFDGQATSQHQKATTYSYDDTTGNILEEINYGEVDANDLSIGGFTDMDTDKIRSKTDYASNTDNWLVAKPYQITRYDYNNTQIKQERFYYDSSTILGEITKGNLTREDAWVNKPSEKYLSTHKTYYDNGNLKTETSPKGYTTTITYDTYGFFPYQKINQLGHTITTAYDLATGKLLTVTDPNGHTISYTYDGFGRVKTITAPDPQNIFLTITKANFEYNDTNFPTYFHQMFTDGSVDDYHIYQYFDGFGRLIQEKKEAEDAKYITRDTWYNKRGEIEKLSLPYPSSTFNYQDRFEYYPISYSYDPLSRVIAETNSLGMLINSYNQWQVTITDRNAKQKTFYYDAFNRLEKVEEKNGAEIYTTNYEYDALDNIIKIIDAQGNERNIEYDSFSRRIRLEELHKPGYTFGSWNYTYDDNSNLEAQSDPKGQFIKYRYDELDRILTEDYQDDSNYEIVYTYDITANSIGMLSRVETSDCKIEYAYDALGRINKETKIFNILPYVTEFRIDVLGRFKSITYPNGLEVTYAYNDASLLETIQDIVIDFDYSPLQQVSYIAFANGTTTTNTYDPSKLYWLTKKYTTSASQILQDIDYSYDNMGNILTLTENATVNAKKDLSFSYDDLYRLTNVTGTYDIDYDYDAIGNITLKGDMSYSYAGTGYPNPHAATQINGISLTYDSNGNLTDYGSKHFDYDYKNRLTKVTEGSNKIEFSYDSQGMRIKKHNITNNKTTLYISKFFEKMLNDQAKSYIFSSNKELIVATIVNDQTVVNFGDDVETDKTEFSHTHITDLRDAVDNLRSSLFSWGLYDWADDLYPPESGAPILASYITKLRAAMEEIYGELEQSLTWDDEDIIVGQTGIKAEHINELRQAIKDIW